MPTLIHIQTKVTTILGVLDDAGNVVQQVPLEGTISGLTVEAFTGAAEALREQREQMTVDLAAQVAEPEGNGQPSDHTGRSASAGRAKSRTR